jgi:hypothetical protein
VVASGLSAPANLVVLDGWVYHLFAPDLTNIAESGGPTAFHLRAAGSLIYLGVLGDPVRGHDYGGLIRVYDASNRMASRTATPPGCARTTR